MIDERLHDSILIRTGLDKVFMGWYLVRRTGQRRCTWADLAASLGLDMHGLVKLALCKAPRDESDLQQIAEYAKASADELLTVMLSGGWRAGEKST